MKRALPVLIAVLGLFLAGCSGTADTGDGYIGGVKKITILDPAERVKAPAITGTDLAGEPISTKDFAGQTLVMNLWGSWCAPCRAEAPVFAAVSKELEGQGVQFLGMLAQTSTTNATVFNDKFGITYPSMYDKAGEYQLAFADSLPSQAVPTTWVIDGNGKVAARILDDKLDEATLRGVIEQVQKTTQR